MEPAATPFLVPREPAPPKTAQRWALWAILSLVTGGLVWGLYRARHSVPSVAFVVSDYCITYYGLRRLYVCLRKHELLRGDDDPAAKAELRRIRCVPWALSLFLGFWMASRVQSAVPSLARNIGLWVLAVLAVGVGLYFLVCICRSSDASADDAGRWPEEVLHDRKVSWWPVARMEPTATPFLVPREPEPPRTAQRWALWAILSLVTGGFAWDLYRARHSVHCLLLVVGDYCTAYSGLLMLYACLTKHELLRSDDDPADATELRRVRRVPWVISVYLSCWLSFRAPSAVPTLASRFGLRVLAVLAAGLGLYFSVASRRSDARADYTGRWPEAEELLHDREVPPEQAILTV